MTSTFLLSRREALKLFGLSAGALVLGGRYVFALDNKQHLLNAFVSIRENETVDIICQRSEMGQGVRTSFAMLIADELDVKWENVRVIQADGDKIYGNQDTDGSFSIRELWLPARQMGATARSMLISAAALEWKVPQAEFKTSDGFVIHTSSEKKLSYGFLAKQASQLQIPSSIILKAHTEFKFIGKQVLAVDAHDMVTGKAHYGIDIDLPDMLIASIERSPAIGGRVGSLKKETSLKIPGVKFVIALDAQPQSVNTEASVAVIATNTWAALKGREKLVVNWDLKNANTDSNSDRLRDLKSALSQPGKVIRNDGDIKLAKVASTYTAEYYSPFLAHATMEPPSATAHVTKDRCEIWAATQHPQRLRESAAKYLGFPEDRVVVHVTLLGGGFGRKSQTDFPMEAVMLSKQISKPVKVTFSREDDIKHDFYHSDSYQTLSAGLNDLGMPITWDHKTAFPTDMSVFDPKTTELADWELHMGASNMPYDIPNVRVEGFHVKSPLKIGWLRSVKNIFHSFSVNTFLDELAEKAKIDPINYRLKLLKQKRILENDPIEKAAVLKHDTSRMVDLIRKIRSEASWDEPLQKGEFRGFACHYSFFTYVAAAVVISLDDAGKILVKRVHMGMDSGFVVNPDAVKAQMQGSIVFGLSLALHGEINVDKGQVRQSNFHDYPVLRMSECPEIHLYLSENNYPPTGVGEPGVPAIAPAIANAIYQATGKRLRDLPLRL